MAPIARRQPKFTTPPSQAPLHWKSLTPPSGSGSRKAAGSKSTRAMTEDEVLDELWEQQLAARAAAEKKEKELRHDPDFLEGEEEEAGGEEEEEGEDELDDEDLRLVNDARGKKRQQVQQGSDEDDLPPSPSQKRPKVKGAGTSAFAAMRSAQAAARGMQQKAVHNNQRDGVEVRPTVEPDDSFGWEPPRTVGGVRTGMQYLAVQMMIGSASGSTPFPREKTQQAILAQWLEVYGDNNVPTVLSIIYDKICWCCESSTPLATQLSYATI